MKHKLSFIAALLLATGSQAQTLKEAYQDCFMIGVAVNQRNIREAKQQELVCAEFNSVTSENDFKPQSVHPQENVWNFEAADRVANFCRERGIKLRGHCLLWHNQIGQWMFYDEDKQLVDKETLFARMRQHIHTVVKRYSDIIYCWDVVNEAITDDARQAHPLRETLFYKICGNDEFIRKAFEYAREADPNALLFYNDYSTVNPDKRDRILNMVRTMKADGVPIDGIGMQAHYNIHYPSEQLFEEAIEKFCKVVDHIHITEMDLRTNFEQGGQLQFSQGADGELSPEDAERQAEQFAMLFRVMRRHADKIDCVTFWNLGDRDSWLGEKNRPLLFDREYNRKPAYYRVVEKK